jgi:hypothetical protein
MLNHLRQQGKSQPARKDQWDSGRGWGHERVSMVDVEQEQARAFREGGSESEALLLTAAEIQSLIAGLGLKEKDRLLLARAVAGGNMRPQEVIRIHRLRERMRKAREERADG